MGEPQAYERLLRKVLRGGSTGFPACADYRGGRDARPTTFSGFTGGPTAHEKLPLKKISRGMVPCYPLLCAQYLLRPKPMTPTRSKVMAAPHMPARDFPALT